MRYYHADREMAQISFVNFTECQHHLEDVGKYVSKTCIKLYLIWPASTAHPSFCCFLLKFQFVGCLLMPNCQFDLHYCWEGRPATPDPFGCPSYWGKHVFLSLFQRVLDVLPFFSSDSAEISFCRSSLGETNFCMRNLLKRSSKLPEIPEILFSNYFLDTFTDNVLHVFDTREIKWFFCSHVMS